MINLIGNTLNNGALVLKARERYDKSYLVLAFRSEKPHPFVVWNADLTNGVLIAYKGDYAESVEEALQHFERRV
jgi:hypothetical protein